MSISKPVFFDSKLIRKTKAPLNLAHKITVDKFHTKKPVTMSIGHVIEISKYSSSTKSDNSSHASMKKIIFAIGGNHYRKP